MSSNTLFQTTVVGVVLAHVGCLLVFWLMPRGVTFLLGLNAVVALAVLIYATTRARYILAACDWPHLGLIAFEVLVLIGAILAYRYNRSALVCSYVAFGLHGLGSLGALLFAFVFKLSKLM